MAKKIDVVANSTIIGGTPDKPEVIANKGERFAIDPAHDEQGAWLERGIVSAVPEVEPAESVSVNPQSGATVIQQS